MTDNYSKKFIQALENKDCETLLSIPKSDVHNHIGRGCRKQWLSEKLNHVFADPPAKFDGLMGMQNWYVNEIRDYTREHDASDLRREGCFVEAQRNHLVRFAPGFAVEDIDEFGSMEAFMDFWHAMHKKYCPESAFEPELAFPSYGDVQKEIPQAEEYFASGFFHSIDVCCGEGYKPFEAFLPLYKIAEKNHVLKRMHVGESGTAEDVEVAVETLGLDEVHHGIHAATSPRVMKLLAVLGAEIGEEHRGLHGAEALQLLHDLLQQPRVPGLHLFQLILEAGADAQGLMIEIPVCRIPLCHISLPCLSWLIPTGQLPPWLRETHNSMHRREKLLISDIFSPFSHILKIIFLS